MFIAHLDAGGDQVVQFAGRAVPGPDYRPRLAPTDRIFAPVQAQAVHLLLGTVAGQAVLFKDWLDIADEIDNPRRSRLGG